MKKYMVSKHSQKPNLSITQEVNKTKENLEHPFADIGK